MMQMVIRKKYSVLTNDQGQAYLVLANEDIGDHQVTASFGGNAKYNPSTASQTITIKEGQSSSPSTNKNSTANSGAYGNSSNSSSSSDDRLYYDYETGNTYDSRGFIIGGQNDGYSLEYIKKHPEKVDDDGNLY